MKGIYVNILSRELAERANQEADLQGLRLSDIVDKALTAYLRSQTSKRKNSKYFLWYVERNNRERGNYTNRQTGLLKATP